MVAWVAAPDALVGFEAFAAFGVGDELADRRSDGPEQGEGEHARCVDDDVDKPAVGGGDGRGEEGAEERAEWEQGEERDESEPGKGSECWAGLFHEGAAVVAAGGWGMGRVVGSVGFGHALRFLSVVERAPFIRPACRSHSRYVYPSSPEL